MFGKSRCVLAQDLRNGHLVPWSPFCSLLCEGLPDKDTIELLRNVVVGLKKKLIEVDLRRADLSKAQVDQACIRGVTIIGRNMRCTAYSIAVGTPVTRRPPHRSQACGATALGSCLES